MNFLDTVFKRKWNRGLDPNGIHVFQTDKILSPMQTDRIYGELYRCGLKKTIVLSGVQLAGGESMKNTHCSLWVTSVVCTAIISFLVGIIMGVLL